MSVNGLILITPTSVNASGTGSSATINTNGSVTFSSCTSLSLNGVFSTDYDNYTVILNATSTASTDIRCRLRASGSDASGNDYIRQYVQASNTSISTGRLYSTHWVMAGAWNARRIGATAHFYGPFLSVRTTYRSLTALDLNNGFIQDEAGTHGLTNSYTGFTISGDYPLTGHIAVYGMRK